MKKKRDPTAEAKERFSQAVIFQILEYDRIGSAECSMSPIERLFLWELLAQATIADLEIRSRCWFTDSWNEGVQTNGLPVDGSVPIFSSSAPTILLTVANEVSVGKYRCDFLIEITDLHAKFRTDRGESPLNGFPLLRHLAIECDGHDFHEKTKKQAAHDRSRDRFFLEQGLPLMRFTGSELWKDSGECVRQALSHLSVNFELVDEVICENSSSLSGFRKG